MSQLTTHILDTSTGKPAAGIEVRLEKKSESGWHKSADGISNEDGRITDLPAAGSVLEIGTYRMIFETQSYFRKQNKKSFYPRVVIEFEVTDNSHYHVPLLLSPFGYSTYRGS